MKGAIQKALSDVTALSKVQTIEEFTPLSLRDVRLLCISIDRIPRNDQISLLSDVIGYLLNYVVEIKRRLIILLKNRLLLLFCRG